MRYSSTVRLAGGVSLQLFLILLLLPAMTHPGCAEPRSVAGPASDSVVAWVRESAVDLAGLDPTASSAADAVLLEEIVGDARVVLLGESRHDAREQFLIKRRIVEYLVTRMGFTLFVLEDSLPGAIPLDRWISGSRDGDAEALLNGIGAWYIWDTPEVLGLVRWMHAYNDDVAGTSKIRFFGMDIVDAQDGIENVVAYLRRVDPDYAASLDAEKLGLDLFSTDAWPQTLERFGELSPERIGEVGEGFRALASRLDDRREAYAASSSEDEHASIRRQAWTVERATEMLARGTLGTFREAGEIREEAMLDNLLWRLDRAEQGSRMIVWAHNVHVARARLDFDIPGRPREEEVDPLGARLSRRLGEFGEEVVVIGFTFDHGSGRHGALSPAPEHSVDGVLARTGRGQFILDLDSAPESGPVRDWLHSEQTMRAQGGTISIIPADAFDALIFTESVSPAMPNPLAVRRFERMEGH